MAERRPTADHPGLPRWVKASLIAAAIAGVVLVAAALISGSGHGPGRHAAGSGAGWSAPPAPADVAFEVTGCSGSDRRRGW